MDPSDDQGTHRRLVALIAWPIVPVAAAVLLLVNSDSTPLACRDSDVGFRRPIPSTCLASLFPRLTGPDPLWVWASWALVAILIYIVLLGWSVYALRRGTRRRTDRGLLRWLPLVIPVVPAIGATAYLIGEDGIMHFCPTYVEPGLPANACFPTLLHAVTGSDLLVITLSWVLAGAATYLGLLGWALVFRLRGPG